MKKLTFSLVMLIGLSANCQMVNKQYNQERNKTFFNNENEIVATENSISIITKVIYNAVPDGYHITYTTSFIGKSVSDVEYRMNTKIDSLIKKVGKLKISRKDIVVDIISLDPIFDFNRDDSIPIGYKIAENITFNIKDISVIRELSKTCLEYGIYDLIDAQAYLDDSKVIYDSLSNKTVEILNMKKKLCADIGWAFTSGKTTLTKFKDVFYPSERYLNSYVSNATLYKHNISQNSTINMERKVDVDNYYNLNLKDADFVFNANTTKPVIQFYYQLTYMYTKKDSEAEMREKIQKEEEKKRDKLFYIIDKAGNLKKVEM
jgi:uncharacterized protein YggE